ncbi:type VI secretion system contractile sheath small subunit [Pseudopelagicola sp. nBUS_19]|uniref:type VI secretion system contractile sheath small subunit n=1 Tax=Pseudopelagicola sp. nBUS_19 TaxID=3395316 RepID=UPI003EBC88E6
MSDSQKFLSKSRAPRVQIEYDVELYGTEKKIQLPFVMAVISDLSGKTQKPSVEERQFLEIDADSFDDRMQAVAPTAKFSVPNTMTGEGSIAVDLTFSKMSDFNPDAIAAKVDGLSSLLEARRQLSDLMAYMDGKSGAETLIENLLASPELLSALAGGQASSDDMDAALDALKAQLPNLPQESTNNTDNETLSALAASARTGAISESSIGDVLSAIEGSSGEQQENAQEKALEALRQVTMLETEPEDEASRALEGLVAVTPEDIVVGSSEDVLSKIERTENTQPDDLTDEILLAAVTEVPNEKNDKSISDALNSLDIRKTDVVPLSDDTDALSELRELPTNVTHEDQSAEDILASLDPVEIGGTEGSSPEDVFGTIEDSTADLSKPEPLASLLSGSDTIENGGVQDRTDDILTSLENAETSASEDMDIEDILGLPESDPDTAFEGDLDATLGTVKVAPANFPFDQADKADDILASLEKNLDDSTKPGDGRGSQQTAAEQAIPSVDSLDDLLKDIEALDDLDELAPQEVDADLNTALSDSSPKALDELSGSSAHASDADVEGLDDLNSILADAGFEESTQDTFVASDDLDALLAGVEEDAPAERQSPVSTTIGQGDIEKSKSKPQAVFDQEIVEDLESDLESLLADLEGDEPEASTDIIGDLDKDTKGDLDALMANVAHVETVASKSETVAKQSPFGTLSVPRPAHENLNRNRFRMAILGDFTGRASRGMREVGSDLAARKPILLDVDTIDEVIESFATSLILPIGKDGTGISVELSELDNLHPDELYENVEMFEVLAGLRQQLDLGAMADKVVQQLQTWSETYGKPVRVPKFSSSTSVPANLKLSDFQALIGDNSGEMTPASPTDELIARIVGPHVIKASDAGVEAMRKALEEAASSAMRMVLHHPDFQAIEAQWRSLDLLARRIETDSSLEIVLYDVSAEELAMDLAAHEELSQSGLFQLLTDVLDAEEGAGGFSALFGLYTFEETPPHAELLSRIGKVAGHVDAPFFTAMTPSYLEIPKDERHPLIAETWNKLRSAPEAAYLGLASPRFLLRQPYGSKSEPTYEFVFEEFTAQEGLSGMLWANPAVLVAILLAGTFKKDGKEMDLGSLLSLGDIPFHFVTDRYGDQVALPCTERNLTENAAQDTLARGFMPVLSIKGRNEIRLGSFRSLSGEEIAGPWSKGGINEETSSCLPTLSIDMEVDSEKANSETIEDAKLLEGLESNATDDQSLDDLLEGFDVESLDGDDDNEIDPELSALLEGL